MEWCLECHRNPEKFLRPEDKVFDMAWQPPTRQPLGAELGKEYGIRSDSR